MKYGEEAINGFDVQRDLEIWPNKNTNDYRIKLTLPEFVSKCPRSGYPDFATIYINYVPDLYVVELKAIKLYINTFASRYISHEDAANEIYSTLLHALKPKELQLVADFNPRGNVHTVIEINSKGVSNG